MDKSELIHLIREDDEVKQAVLDMLAEEVDIRVECREGNDYYSGAPPICTEVSIEFGNRTDEASQYGENLNRISDDDCH